MSEDALRAELDESNDMLSEALGLLADAHAKMLIPICVHCDAKPGPEAKETHWRECKNHPAHRAVARLESELREAREEMAGVVEERDTLYRVHGEAQVALSAERTARRVMREAWGALRANILVCEGGSAGMRGAWFRQGDEVALIQAVDAALAAEPGEGPGGPAAEAWRGKVVQDAARVVRAWWPMVKPLLGKHADLLDAWDDDAERLADRLDDLAALLTLPPEGHPRAAEGAADGCTESCPPTWTDHWREFHRGHGCTQDPNMRAAEVKNEG